MNIRNIMYLFNTGYTEEQIVKELELSEEDVIGFRIKMIGWFDRLAFEANLRERYANFN